MKILAAVVTYNRKELLLRCIRHIQSQSRKANQILIVDNGSTDGTKELLLHENVVLITQPNLGSAGGWNRAISYAIDHNYDAVWLMDDDGYPSEDSLRILEPLLLPNISCASSVVLQQSRHDHFVFPFPRLNQLGLPSLAPFNRKFQTLHLLASYCRTKTYPFAHLFNGALINIAAAKSIGNVNQSYFLYGDEVDYFCRLRRYGPVISALDAHHFHPDVRSRPLTFTKAALYVRNSLWVHKLYFDKPVLRSILTIIAAVCRVLRRNKLTYTLTAFLTLQPLRLFPAIYAGLIHSPHDCNN